MSARLFGSGRALIVAEIGNNHEGKLEVALELVKRAATAGADAVKFQTYRTERFVNRSDAARFERLKMFELTPDAFGRLAEAARTEGLLFFSTPLDLESVSTLEPLVNAFKVASGDITFLPLIQAIARTGKPVILSTGASEVEEIESAIALVQQVWRTGRVDAELAVLHCVSCYPTPDEQASLKSIGYLASTFGCPVGYSDHTLGIEASAFAAVLGACVIEKHFTLDKHYSDFRDHQLSADPHDFAELVSRIRRFERMAGHHGRTLQPCETSMREAIRRSIVASQNLPAGHRLQEADLAWLRPASGLMPGQELALVGRRTNRYIAAGEQIKLEDTQSLI